MTALARLLTLLLCALCACAAPPARVSASGGVLDLSDRPEALDGVVGLTGQWMVWWGVPLSPEQLDGVPPSGLVAVPGSWEGAPFVPGGAPPTGVATFRLQVRLPAHAGPLLLRSNSIAVAHRMWVNGVELQSLGQVGTDAGSEVPDMRPLVRILPEGASDLDIVVQVSNFHHREGGIRRAPELGPPELIASQAQGVLVGDVFGISTLLASGLYFLVIYRMRPNNRATLYFSLFCLDLALRSSSAGGAQVLRVLWPDLPWSVMLRLEYLTTYLGLGLSALMMAAMFPLDAPWRWVRASVTLSGGLAAVALLAPMSIYTRSLPLFQLGTLVQMGVFAVELSRATRQRRPLALFALAGVALFCLGVIHDILQANHIISTSAEISTLTLLLFLLVQAWGHAREFKRSYTTIEQLSQRLIATNADLEQTNRAVERFVPYAFLDLLHKASIKDVQRGDHIGQDMGILFCDLRGFTTVVEAFTPEAAFDFINRYLRVMEPPIHAHGGFINQYLGDCIMALFPGELDRALSGALAMLGALREWNAERMARGEPPALVGVGMSAGPLMLGTIGGMDRLDNGVIGDAVNRSARLEGLTKHYDTAMIADEHLVKRLARPEAFALRALDRVVLKGKVEPVRLYDVLGALPPEVAERRLLSAPEFNRAMVAWERGDFAAAQAGFDAVLARDPADGPARRMAQRCAARIGAPSEGWAGFTVMAEK